MSIYTAILVTKETNKNKLDYTQISLTSSFFSGYKRSKDSYLIITMNEKIQYTGDTVSLDVC